MFEVRIIRSNNKYDIIVNNEKIIYGIWTSSFSNRNVNFFDYSNASLVATYKEKRKFIFADKRSIYFYQLETEYQISNPWASYSLHVYDSTYSIRYGLFTMRGFFLNDKKVGKIEILRSGNLDYEKRIVFSESIKEYLPFIYMFIPVDYNDFN